MTNTLNTATLIALLMGTVHGAQANESKSADEWKKELETITEDCKDSGNKLERLTCVWDEDSKKMCKNISKNDFEKEFECEALFDPKYTRETYDEEKSKFDKFVDTQNEKISALIATAVENHEDSKTLSEKVSPWVKGFRLSCEFDVKQIKTKLNSLLKIYKSIAGKSCVDNKN